MARRKGPRRTGYRSSRCNLEFTELAISDRDIMPQLEGSDVGILSSAVPSILMAEFSSAPIVLCCGLRRVIRLRRYSANRYSAEKRRISGGSNTSVPKFGMGWSPSVPYGPLLSPWSHATCYMWCNTWANHDQPMGHGYGIRVIVVHCGRHHDS